MYGILILSQICRRLMKYMLNDELYFNTGICFEYLLPSSWAEYTVRTYDIINHAIGSCLSVSIYKDVFFLYRND